MKKLKITLLFILFGLVLSPGKLRAYSDDDGTLDSANAAYSEGLYNEALEGYMRIYDKGFTSAALCYNIANTHFKLEDLPSAILFYERALRLKPSDEDIQYNLALTRSRIIDKIEPVPQLFFIEWWHKLRDIYGADGWARASLISFILLLALILFFLVARKPMVKRLFFWPAVIVLIVLMHTLAFSWQKSSIEESRAEAIIFKPTVTVKSSPDKNSVDLFVIHEGTKVMITDELGNWLEVKIASGNQGWVAASTLERI